MTRADRVLIFGVIVALTLLYYKLWFDQGQPTFVLIKSGDNPVYTETLEPARHIHLTGLLGESVVESDGSRVRFISSPCPSKVCVQSGWLEDTGELVACLPNRVSLSLSGKHPRFDAINF